MKKLILLMSLVAIAIGFAGCNNDDPTERQREAIANQSLIGGWCATKIQYNESEEWYEITKDNKEEHSCYFEFRNDKEDNSWGYNAVEYSCNALHKALGGFYLFSNGTAYWETDGHTILLYKQSTHQKYDTGITFEFTNIGEAVFRFPYEDSFVTMHMTRLSDLKNKDMTLNNCEGKGDKVRYVSYWAHISPTHGVNNEVEGFIEYVLKFSACRLFAYTVEYAVLPENTVDGDMYFNGIEYVPCNYIEYDGKTFTCDVGSVPLAGDTLFYYTFNEGTLTASPIAFADFHTYPAQCEDDKLTITVDGVDYVFNKVTIKSE